MPNEIAIRKMMEACDQDPALQAELFKNPVAVAKKHHVDLSDDEVEQLKRVGTLMNLVGEFKAGRVGGRGPASSDIPSDILSTSGGSARSSTMLLVTGHSTIHFLIRSSIPLVMFSTLGRRHLATKSQRSGCDGDKGEVQRHDLQRP